MDVGPIVVHVGACEHFEFCEIKTMIVCNEFHVRVSRDVSTRHLVDYEYFGRLQVIEIERYPHFKLNSAHVYWLITG